MTLTIGSLFAGIGGFDLGFERAGFKTIWQCEIDKAAQGVLRRWFPDAALHSDVCEVGAHNLEPVDVVTFGSPCFPAGVLILTKRGIVPIEEVIVGDEVVSHLGRWQPVVRVGSKIAPTLRLKGQGHPGLVTTEEHPFWASSVGRKWNNEARIYRRDFSPLEWVPAKDMKGKMWSSLTAFPAAEIPAMVLDKWETACPVITPELMWVVGSWVGDGYVRDGKRPGRENSHWGNVVIADGKGEASAEVARRMTAAGLSFFSSEERTAVKHIVSSAPFARWLTTHFGKYAEGKTIPAWLLGAPLEMREAFLQGYLFADGSRLADKGYRTSSVSKALTFGIAMLIRCTRPHSVSLYFTKAHVGRQIEGRDITERDSWQAHAHFVAKSSVVLDGYRMGLVRECEATGVEERVYNIEVEGDNSYTADGIIVHNCQDFSIAGKRAGLAGGRSGLFHEAARVIRELRERYGKPDFAIWENVPGAFSSNDGRDFAAVVQAMVDLGARDICWRVLDSQNFGVAQRRRRVFLVADFGGERAEQILFESESLRGNPAKGRKARKETSGSAGEGATGGSGDAVTPAVTSKWAKGTGGPAGDECQNLVAQPVAFDTTQITSPYNYSSPKAGDPCHPLAAGAHPPAVAFAQNTRDEVRLVNGDGQLVGALAAQPGMKQTTYVAQPVAFQLNGNRHNPSVSVSEGVAFCLPSNPMSDRGQAVAQPYTLAIRGRGDGRNLEYRNDGTANALLLPNGGRDGLGVGAVATVQPQTTWTARNCAPTLTGNYGKQIDSSDTSLGPNLVVQQPIAIPIISDADRFNSTALTPSPDAEGRVRLRNPGLGIGSDGDPMFTLQATKPHSVAVSQPIAFHPTQDPISSTNGVSHAMSNGSKGGTATATVAVLPCDGSAEGVVPPLMARSSRGGAQTLSPGHQTDGHCVAVCATGEVTHALTASDGATEDGTGRGTPRAAFLPMQVRRLTPTECEALQGFPRNHTAEIVTSDGKIKPQADGPRYKQLGNAVTVNVAEWIAKRLAASMQPPKETTNG